MLSQEAKKKGLKMMLNTKRRWRSSRNSLSSVFSSKKSGGKSKGNDKDVKDYYEAHKAN